MFFNQAFLQKHLDALSIRIDSSVDQEDIREQVDDPGLVVSYTDYLKIKYGVQNVQMMFNSSHLLEIQRDMRASLVREKDMLVLNRVGAEEDITYEQKISATENYVDYIDGVAMSLTVETLFNIGILTFKNFHLEKKNLDFNIRYDENGKIYTQSFSSYIQIMKDMLTKNGVNVKILNDTYDDIKMVCYGNFFRYYQLKKVAARDFNPLIFGMKTYPYIKTSIDPNRDQKIELALSLALKKIQIPENEEKLEVYSCPYVQIIKTIETMNSRYLDEARMVRFFNSLYQLSECEMKVKVLTEQRSINRIIYLVEEGLVAKDELFMMRSSFFTVESQSKRQVVQAMAIEKYIIVYLDAFGMYYYKKDSRGIVLDTPAKIKFVMKVVRDFFRQIVSIRDYSFLYWEYFEKMLISHQESYSLMLHRIYGVEYEDALLYMKMVFDCYTVSLQLVQIPEPQEVDPGEEVEIVDIDNKLVQSPDIVFKNDFDIGLIVPDDDEEGPVIL